MTALLASLQNLFPEDCHGRVLLVGGSVRDVLLGKPNEDIDLVAILPEDVLRNLGFRLVEGKTTAPLWFRHDHALGKIEVTPLEDDASLNDDLLRRDFTINSMCMRLTGELHDPLNGQGDLRDRRLRACSDNTFLGDPVRIFRAFRFECDGWQMTPETESLLRRSDWTRPLSSIPVERFSREMLKALSAGEPGRFFERMLHVGVGKGWLPELFQMTSVPAGPAVHHPEGDLFAHSMGVLRRVAGHTDDPLTRFCAFFHDIGKLSTDPMHYPKHHGHDEAGFGPAVAFCNRLCLPAVYRKALSWTSRLHMHLNSWGELRDSTKIRIADRAAKAGIASILPIVALADRPGAVVPDGWGRALEVAAMATADLGIDAERLFAMPAESRAAFILQTRVRMLRGASQPESHKKNC